VIRGEQKVPVASAETLKKLIKETTLLEMSHPMSGVKSPRDKNLLSFANGTASFLAYYDKIGEIPTKNGLSNSWGKGKDIYQNLLNHITGDEGCLNCVLRCGKRSEVKEGKWKTPEGEGPEYETVAGFAHYIMNDNVEAIIHINHLCNDYGIDTISCANAIAFAMECYEKGVITKEDTDGIELTWGNIDAAKQMVIKIVNREGVGAVLAEGVLRAAEKLGKGSHEFALHVKGLELPAHDTRSKGFGKAWAIQYGTANRGMCHCHPQEPGIVHAIFDDQVEGMRDLRTTLKEPFNEVGKGKMVKWAQDFGNISNTLGLCIFHSYLIPGAEFNRYTKAISAATDLEMAFDELMKIGERLSSLQRCFNVREGTRRKDDRLPKRLLQIPAFGPYSNRPETEIKDYEAMLDEYYEARGWNKSTGIPEKGKLEELGIEWADAPNS
jgi:aldehyde:ferredoxin oxidoreductase